MKIKTLFALTTLLLLLTACGGNDINSIAEDIAAIDAPVGTITEIDCPLKLPGEEEGETYYCGAYTVPLDYGNPEGNALNLAFVVLKAENANPLPDPIVYLAGGPGQSGVVSAGGALYSDLRQQRDLIFPAQRGTLFSHRLALDECVALLADQMGKRELEAFAESFSDSEAIDRSLSYDEYLAQYGQRTGEINGRCHGAFGAAGLDPAQYTTANSTHDLVGLVDALGYDSFNLHGVSYGTRLALETVRRHPDAGIRAIVLDSPAAPSVDRLAALAGAVHDSVVRLFDVCASDADCNAAYPNLIERTNALADRLAAQPISAGDQTIGAAELIEQLTDLTGTRANYLPRMIAELESGDPSTYLALLSREVGTQSPEGSTRSPQVGQFVTQISEAASEATPKDILGNLQVVAEILKAAATDQPKEAMKVAAQEKLADSEDLPRILERIDSFTPGELDELAALTAGAPQEVDEDEVEKAKDAQAKNNALFMLSGIVCHEQLPFADADRALAMNNDLRIPALRGSEALLATEVGNCTNYPMGEPDPSYHDPVSSELPILILQGEFDTRTPLGNGLALADQLDNATLVVIPQIGHETWTGSACISQVASSFITNPDVTLDLSCLEIRQERFVLPEEPLAGQTEP